MSTIKLTDLDLSLVKQSWGKPHVNEAVSGKPLSLGGQTYAEGLGSHANCAIFIELSGAATRFTATVGVDDNAQSLEDRAPGRVIFRVWADTKQVFGSGVMHSGGVTKIDVDLTGSKTLVLELVTAGDTVNCCHGDWCATAIDYEGAAPRIVAEPVEEQVILTPKPGPAPRLNNALRYGCRPGHPFLYRIPAQGERPMCFAAANLPAGLALNATTGIITGSAPAAGEYDVTLTATNAVGTDSKKFAIVAGDTLALTPTMGWNDWYAFTGSVTDQLMRESAERMLSNGMADVGYDYVNIDDCWMNAAESGDPKRVGPARAEDGTILSNGYFPDMPALTEYLHDRGFKAGIYIGPGPTTCAGFTASWQHEAQDAATFAEWGFDLLKYDWCSYGGLQHVRGRGDRATLMAPYTLMGKCIHDAPRDMIFNLCQYGMGAVWEWGRDVYGQSWRTGGDLVFYLDNFEGVALEVCEHRAYNGPGGWNDPDFIMIGNQGPTEQPRPYGVSPNRCYAFMSLWCLMAVPLIYTGDIATLDEFTLSVLTNAEMVEVNQDPLGQCGAVSRLDDTRFILVKDLVDGGKAVGLFNRGPVEQELTVPWRLLGFDGAHAVRDLWRQEELGESNGEFTAHVPSRGVVVVKVKP